MMRQTSAPLPPANQPHHHGLWGCPELPAGATLYVEVVQHIGSLTVNERTLLEAHGRAKQADIARIAHLFGGAA